MTYLAYDPERIGALITAMRAALDDLASFVADDPLALDALGRVRLARVHLEQLWLPLLERIVASDPLADPTALPLDDVVQSLLRAVALLPGWALAEVGTDPLGAAPTSPPMPAQAVALADVLRRGDLAELTDTAAERAWLATELALVAGDPVLAAAFAAAFDRWGALGDQLGHHRQVALDDRTQPPADDARLDAARIDEAFAAIGAIWVGVHGSAAIPALTRTMAPYAAAALVRRTALDPDRLAWLSAELLHRLDRDRPGTWPEDRVGGPKTGDLLFQTILATPGAATAFVIAVVAEPGLLWWSAADASLAQRVALTGTDPTAIGAADAGAVLHAFAEWFAALDLLSRNNLVFTAAPLESRATLGALAAPWLVSYGPGVDDWGDDPGPRRADLAFIIDDAGARRAVFAQLAADTAGMGGDTAVHRHDQAAAAAIGMLLQLDAERTIRAGEDAKESWDGMWELVGRAVGFVGRRGGPEVAAIAAMLDRALVEVKRVADRNGWLGAPPAPGDVAARARSAQQRILLGSAATAVMAGYLTLRAAGELPPGTPPPPVPAGDDVQAYWREYRDWREAHVPPRSEAEQVLDGQFGLFLSPAEIGARAATG